MSNAMAVEPVKYLLVYVLTLLLAVSEVFPLSVSAMLGALLMAWFGLNDGLFTYEEIFSFIDLRLIALLIGVMITVETVGRSGLFRVLGLYAVKLAGGSPAWLFVALSVISAATSLFLSDAAAVLILSATALAISRELGYDPTPFVVASALMINLGGTGTLIGSVSNMIIGLNAGFDFVEFAAYLLPCELMLWWVTIALLYLYYRERLRASPRLLGEYRVRVENKGEVAKAALILTVMIALYVSSERLGIPAEAVALFTAVLALTSTRYDPVEIFERIDWDTVFFVASFLVLVHGLERTGILQALSQLIYEASRGSLAYATLLTLLVSGVTSMFLANVAVALTFVPPLKALNLPDKRPLWSALVLGTNLGGASIPVTSVVFAMAVGALRHEGLRVDMGELSKVGLLTSLAQLAFSALYLLAYFKLPF